MMAAVACDAAVIVCPEGADAPESSAQRGAAFHSGRVNAIRDSPHDRTAGAIDVDVSIRQAVAAAR